MNRRAEHILYSPLWLLFHLIALLPFRVLYLISDVLAFFAYRVVRYRRKMVRRNLEAAFPEKTEAERLKIERRFYRNFTDIFVETVKQLHLSDDEMRRRLVFEGTEQINEYMAQHRSVALYGAHFCNWEWLTSITLWIDRSHDHVLYSQVYRPLRNKWFDDFYFRLRKRFYTHSIAKNNVLRELVASRRNGGSFVTGFISDQKPSHNDGQHRVMFLNQETPFITGTEMLMKKLNAAVMFFDVHRVRRGYYRVSMRLIADEAKNCKDFEITDTFARMLEDAIRKEPDAWLWSHNRWRRPKTELK